jgi:hypothetical protein
MKIVKANKSCGNTLTKGKEYHVIRELLVNYIVIDDTGVEVGFNKDWFDLTEEFNPEQFAISIITLMLFPKSKDFTTDDIIKAKAYSHLVIENVKRNCENDSELKQVEQIKEAIDNIESF